MLRTGNGSVTHEAQVTNKNDNPYWQGTFVFLRDILHLVLVVVIKVFKLELASIVLICLRETVTTNGPFQKPKKTTPTVTVIDQEIFL